MRKDQGVHAAILAGGSGTRFWPASRENLPKQFLRLAGEARTLIEDTMLRAMQIVPAENIMVVAKSEYRNETVRLLSPHGFVRSQFVDEPMARNTAAAIGLAALKVRHQDPDGVMVVLPSDHVVKKLDRFGTALADAVALARKGHLVTLGVKPYRPETGYGYIEVGEALEGSGLRVDAFHEKPDYETAKNYIRRGNFYWNAGIFVWRADAIIEAMRAHMPDLAAGLDAIEGDLLDSDDPRAFFTRAEHYASIYAGLESVSIDYGVLERADNLACVPVDMEWSDLGSWESYWEYMPKDARGNVLAGKVIDIDSSDCLVQGDKRLVATIDMHDVVIVDTPDALLVCPRQASQRVRDIVDELRRRGSEEYIEHRTVERPWGYYTVLEEGPRYKIKKIGVLPGGRLSLQSHHHRSEHWIVVSGTARVTRADERYFVHANESTYIPACTKHRLENPGKIMLEIIEIQNGDYLGEDDIIRYDDDYARD
ncbi:MAG: mannose-1-phosphate guanylyltransferase/mannose-6-phosphate isomerase [Zetaproteobacteria bacterium]|nr:MAG: mannose-1-phosphate guanylyltransferase/mannose-6-phosphate isomerase [Zetaproteobacteria bacterium]